MGEKQMECPRAWPCRYRNARQCARDTMLGAECPKVCECVCHSESGEVYLSEIAVAAALLLIIAIAAWQMLNS
jgi:hypothetical protein